MGYLGTFQNIIYFLHFALRDDLRGGDDRALHRHAHLGLADHGPLVGVALEDAIDDGSLEHQDLHVCDGEAGTSVLQRI